MNLFIVESPFQLLSAIEASHYFSNEKNMLIVKYLPGKKNLGNNNQLDLLLKIKSWDSVIKIDRSVSHFHANVKLLSYIKKVPQINFIFIGELRSWYMRQYFNILNNNGCYSLDDGNSTIFLQETIIKERTYFKLKGTKFFVKMLLKHLILYLIFLKFYKMNSHINLFTCFDVEKSFKDQILLKNDFKYCKDISHGREISSKTAYFFGGGEDVNGIMDQDDLFYELLLIKKYFSSRGISLVYIPHRVDTKPKLERIQKDLKCKVLCFKYPAEVEFILMTESPEYISSFCSTALYTVSLMLNYQDKALSFLPSLDKMSSKNRFEYQQIFNDYKKHLTVINLRVSVDD